MINKYELKYLNIAGFRRHSIHIPRLVKHMRCGVVPVPLLVKTSICMVWTKIILTTLSNGDVLQKRQEKLNMYMFCLENLMYRCRYQTDTSVWINSILHFFKGKREWKWCPGASFSLFSSKQVSVWQMSNCLKPTFQTIHCISLSLPIVLYPTHDICSHVCSASWDTRPGLLCRLDSTTRPRYAVSSEPWNIEIYLNIVTRILEGREVIVQIEWTLPKAKTKKKSRIRETPTISTDADSRTDTILERLRDLSIRTEKRTWSTQKWGLGPR